MFGWFKKKVTIQEIIKQANEDVQNKATEAAVEAIIKEVKKESKVVYLKPKHFPDCNCFKCERWRKQNA